MCDVKGISRSPDSAGALSSVVAFWISELIVSVFEPAALLLWFSLTALISRQAAVFSERSLEPDQSQHQTAERMYWSILDLEWILNMVPSPGGARNMTLECSGMLLCVSWTCKRRVCTRRPYRLYTGRRWFSFVPPRGKKKLNYWWVKTILGITAS